MPDDTPAALPQPALDTKKQFGARIQVSERTVTRLIAKGMPAIDIGDLDRIDPEAALEWLRSRRKPKPIRRGRPAKRTPQ